jgi:hypothetical protein
MHCWPTWRIFLWCIPDICCSALLHTQHTCRWSNVHLRLPTGPSTAVNLTLLLLLPQLPLPLLPFPPLLQHQLLCLAELGLLAPLLLLLLQQGHERCSSSLRLRPSTNCAAVAALTLLLLLLQGPCLQALEALH